MSRELAALVVAACAAVAFCALWIIACMDLGEAEGRAERLNQFAAETHERWGKDLDRYRERENTLKDELRAALDAKDKAEALARVMTREG